MQNRQIFSGSDASMLLDLNERVSKLENELQTLKENQSSKELSEMDLLKKKMNFSRPLENLNSKMTTSFQKTNLLMNETNVLTSEKIANVFIDIRNLTTTLDYLESKIDIMQKSQQKLSQAMKSIETSTKQSLAESK